MIERRQRVVFEKREGSGAPSGLDALETRDQLGIAGLDTIDADPLVVASEMRRGETSAAQSGGAQRGVNAGNGRTLAVGTTNGDDPMCGTQQAETVRDFANARQIEIDGARM